MTITTVSAKGWVVIPKEIRDRYGFYPGRKVRIVDGEGILYLLPVPEDPIASAYGMLKECPERYQGVSLTEALITEHRQEVEQEQATAEPAAMEVTGEPVRA